MQNKYQKWMNEWEFEFNIGIIIHAHEPVIL